MGSHRHAQFQSDHSGCRRRLAFALGAVLVAARAAALQPLDAFLEGARAASTSSRQAGFVAQQRAEEATASLGSVLPSLSASGTATRNEKAVSLATGQGTSIVIQPLDQVTGSVSLSVPILDAAGWARWTADRATASAARESARSTRLQVEGQVANAYYTLVGAGSLARARARSLTTAEQDLALTRTKREEGTATALDVSRAEAEVEKVRQQVADAELTGALARRTLRTLTRVDAEGEAEDLTDDLRAEEPLARWEGAARTGSAVIAVAGAERAAADAQAGAAKLALLPTVTGSATEYASSSGGLTGQSQYHTFTANLTWTFDLTSVANIRARGSAAEAARVAERAAGDQALDDVHEAWQRVATGIAKSRSARAQAAAATTAAEVARERYAAGTGTQLELVQAERDRLDAEASRIQADADLAYQRAALRLAAGVSLTAATGPSAAVANPEGK